MILFSQIEILAHSLAEERVKKVIAKLIIIPQNLYVIPIIGLIHFRPLFVGINTAQYFTVIT